jgi:hypothetical protein
MGERNLALVVQPFRLLLLAESLHHNRRIAHERRRS